MVDVFVCVCLLVSGLSIVSCEIVCLIVPLKFSLLGTVAPKLLFRVYLVSGV